MKTILRISAFLFCLFLSIFSALAQKHEWLRTTTSSRGYVMSRSISTDASSSSYISGHFYTKDSIDFHTGPEKQMVYGSGVNDAFLLKLDSSGSFQWCSTYGNGYMEQINDSYIDNHDNILIVGSFSDTIRFNGSDPDGLHIANGSNDGFLAKYDAHGNYLWSFTLGGNGSDLIRAINIDNENNLYLMGFITDSVDMDPGPAKHILHANATDSAHLSRSFILKLDSAGIFQWAKSYDLHMINLGINKYNHLLFTANLPDSAHIFIKSGVQSFYSKGVNDILFGRMNSKGEIEWINQIQSDGKIKTSFFEAFANDLDGHFYLCGSFYNSINLLNSPNDIHHSLGDSDGFLCKFDTSGNEIWFKTFGGKNHTFITAITLDDSNNLYLGVSPQNRLIKFQSGNGSVYVKSDVEVGYLVQFDANGNFEWAKELKGRTNIEAIDWNQSNDLYSTGSFRYLQYNDSLYIGGWSDIFILKTAICDPIPFYDTLFLCAGDTSFISNLKPEHAGNYSELVENEFGCDSLQLTHIVIYPSYPDTTFYSFCEGDSLRYFGSYYSTDTSFVYSATSVLGCDSSKVVIIKKDTTVVTEIKEQICEGDTLMHHNRSYFKSGIYKDTLHTVKGCDSVIALDLTVHPVKYTQQNVAVCEGKSYRVGSSYYFHQGTYTDTLTSHINCDSIVTTVLSIDSLPRSEQYVTMCAGGSYSIGNSTYYQAGTYTDTMYRFRQCDIIMVTYLSVTQRADSSIFIELCEGDSVVINEKTYHESGTFLQTFDFGKCQLKLHINIAVFPVPITNQYFALCLGDSIKVGNEVYYTSGTYINTLKTINGCDSIIETIIDKPEFQLLRDEKSLNVRSKKDFKNLQIAWYNCDSKRIVKGEVGERFEYKWTGRYTAIVEIDGCRDTLKCNQVWYDNEYKLKIFPNPAKNVTTIAVPSSGKIRLINSRGNLVKEHYFYTPTEYIYPIENLAIGIYFIIFDGDQGVLTEKLSIVK